jgi:hypothetical protein
VRRETSKWPRLSIQVQAELKGLSLLIHVRLHHASVSLTTQYPVAATLASGLQHGFAWLTNHAFHCDITLEVRNDGPAIRLASICWLNNEPYLMLILRCVSHRILYFPDLDILLL